MWLFIIFACLNACVDPSFNSGASNRQYKCEQIAVLFIQNVSAEPTLGEFMIMKAYCDFFLGIVPEGRGFILHGKF